MPRYPLYDLSSGGGGGLASVTADAPLSGAGTSGSHLVIASATGSVVGVVKLAQDLGGTAALPTVVNLSNVTNASLPASGIAAVNPSILTGTGTVPIGGIPTGSSSSTVAIGNDARLSDARTPTAHGATTHREGGTDSMSPMTCFDTGTAFLNMHPFMAGSNTATSAGVVLFCELTAARALTVSNITFLCAVSASGTVTLVRAGLFTVSGTTYTIVARTASQDLTGAGTFLKTANTVYTVAFDTTGSFPSSVALVAGTRYAVGLVGVGASAVLTPRGNSSINPVALGFLGLPQTSHTSAGGQTDLPTTVGATLAGAGTTAATALFGLS